MAAEGKGMGGASGAGDDKGRQAKTEPRRRRSEFLMLTQCNVCFLEPLLWIFLTFDKKTPIPIFQLYPPHIPRPTLVS